MFENKKINMAISIVVAALIWAYVIGSINPPAEGRFKGIPITMTNTEVLESKGLAVKDCSAEYIDLVLSGTRSDMSKLRTDEIKAVVDLSNALEGENEFTIDIHVPDNIDIEQKSVRKLVVEVEKLKTASVDVEIVYSGETNDGSEVRTESVSQEQVTVKGAESLVNEVKAARGTVDTTSVGESASEISCTLVPVNNSGAQVDNVRVNPGSVTVTSVLFYDKTVPLKLQITDDESENLEKTWTAPEEVTICGEKGLIEGIDSVEAEVVDISAVTEDTEIEIVPMLPEGVYLSEKNESLILSVKVEGESEETFTLTGSDINLTGSEDQVIYRFGEDSFNVTVLGTRDELEALTKDDVLLVADVSGIRKGESAEVTLAVSIRGTELSASVSPETVTVTAE